MTKQSSDLRRVVASTAIYAVAGLGQRGLAFVLLPVYTRVLEPAQYGVLELLNAFTALAFALLMMGLPSAVTKVYHRDAETVRAQDAVLSTALWLGIPVMAAGTILLGLASREISALLIGTREASSLVRLSIASGAFSSATAVVLGDLRAREQAVPYAVLTVSQFGLAMVLNILLVVKFELGVAGVLWGNLASHALVFLAALLSTLTRSRLTASRQLVLPLLKFGLLLVPVMLCGWVIDLSDRYLLRVLSSLDEVAVYGVGYKIGLVLQIVLVWPFQLAWPAVSFSISRREGHQETYARVLTYFAALLAYGALGLSLASRMGLSVLVGEGYGSAYRVVPLVALSQVFNGLYFCMSPGVHVAGKTGIFLPLSILAAGINIGLNIVLIPRYGMLGAGAATVAAFFSLMAGTWLGGRRYYPIAYEGARLVKIAAAAVLTYMLATRVPFGESVFLSLLYAALTLVGFPILLASLGFLEPAEKDRVRASLDRWVPRRWL